MSLAIKACRSRWGIAETIPSTEKERPKDDEGKIIDDSLYLNPALIEFWDIKIRYKVLFGGRASGKSHSIASILILTVYTAKEKLKVLCTRAFQSKIDDSVKALLEAKIKHLNISSAFDIQSTKITCNRNDSEIKFMGLSRNTGEVQGYEDVDICFIEEGQFLTHRMWQVLAPTIRKQGSQVWLSFNPLNRSDFIYKNFVVNTPKNCVIKKINYNENIYLSDTMREEIEIYKDHPDFSHVYLGECKDDDDLTVMSYRKLSETLNTTIFESSSTRRIGVDIADGGEDNHAISINDSGVITYLEEMDSHKFTQEDLAERVLELSYKYDIKDIHYDSIGVGAGFGVILKLKVRSGWDLKLKKFVASEKVKKPQSKYKILGNFTKIKNEEYFENLKAQAWINIRDSFYSGLLHFGDEVEPKVLEKALIELSSPYLIDAGERKVKIESKKDMKKRGVVSPNIADAIIISGFGVSLSW